MAVKMFEMKVSDIVEVPLRGQMLRLKVVSGAVAVSDLAVGRKLRLTGPSGEQQVVEIVAHTLSGGNVTQKRLDQYGEFDALVRPVEGAQESPIDYGFRAEPVRD